MKHIISKIVVLACLAVLCVGAACGCSGQSSTTLTDSQQSNRAYMQSVNTAMSGFESLYADFRSAIETGDVDQAKKCVDEGATTLESLKAIEAPEALADIHQSYVAGSEKLVQAVNEYYALLSGNTDTSSVDFHNKVAEIQALYNEGVTLLRDADAAASAKE